jgi:hypothetical protein
VIARWLAKVKAHTDVDGCIPHAWDPITDMAVESARGSSQGLMNCFLPVIDSLLARDQYERYCDRFLDVSFGVPIVREYPKGQNGSGDVDSGPVIFGAGSSATIVGAGACRANRDWSHAQAVDASIEGFGLPIGNERERYLFGQLPIADLFIAWTRSMDSAGATQPATVHFTAFHAWSVLLAVLLWLPYAWLKARG